MKENCLILGAGLMQKPAILSAKELGYRVCVVDADDKAVALPFADEFRKIDLKDKDGILFYAKELSECPGGLALVFTAGTDFSASVSYVCEKMNLHAHSCLLRTPLPEITLLLLVSMNLSGLKCPHRSRSVRYLSFCVCLAYVAECNVFRFVRVVTDVRIPFLYKTAL